MIFTDHEVTLGAIGASAVAILTGVAKATQAVARVGRSIDRISEDVRSFRGRDADPEHGLPEVPGVMTQLATLNEKADSSDRGNIEILRRQDEAAVAHQRLAGRVSSIESKVSQTLNAVSP